MNYYFCNISAAIFGGINTGLGLAFHLKVKGLLNWAWLVFLDVKKRLMF